MRIVLQARFTSNRLPGKALLPIGGLPMVVLAARRMMRTGLPLVVATSTEDADDRIATECAAAGIAVVRGPLEDVHARFLLATSDLPDSETIIRATADNVLPDGNLLDALVDAYRRSGSRYLAPRHPADGLPYGVIAEVFHLGTFRALAPQSEWDREHVTPAIARAAGNPGFPTGLPYGALRATVDTSEDYAHAQKAFRGVRDPIAPGWEQLVRNLAGLPGPWVPRKHKQGRLVSELTLGTVQFGLKNYGIANVTGRPGPEAVRRMLGCALEHGVTQFDTARAYGESERRLGKLMPAVQPAPTVITKLVPLRETDSDPVAAADMSIEQSLQALGRGSLDILMLHRADNIRLAGGAVWRRLLERKERGVIGCLGVSVQSPEELKAVADTADVDAIQLPLNLLDHRWSGERPLRREILVYARSVLLQGLLSGLEPSKWPSVDGVDAGAVAQSLQQLASDLNRSSTLDLAIAFVRAQGWVDSLVIGAETQPQLQANLDLFARPALEPAELDWARSRMPRVPNSLLDPSQWPR